MIEVRALTRQVGDCRLLDSLHVDVAAGETVAIIGPSGAGKSTFLRCLNGLEVFQEGSIQIAGQELRPENHAARQGRDALGAIRRQVGMVFQNFNLFPHLTVMENLCLAPRVVLKKTPAEAQAAALQLLEQVNLGGMEKRYPRQLSGGEQQRVAIARALAMQPQAILFDEPTSSLDPELVLEVVEVIERLARQKYTLLLVTHQMRVARRVAGRVLFFDRGRILEDSPADRFFAEPATERAREFLRALAI